MYRDNYDRCMLPFRTFARTVCPAAGVATWQTSGSLSAGLAAHGLCQTEVLSRGNKACLK